MYQRLLVPLDGSRLAESVLPVVERLALTFGASVLLLHVLERRAPEEVHGERHLQALDEAEAYLRDAAARLEARGIHVEWHAHEVPEGDVTGSIVGHVREEQADLIVMCTHGSGGVRDLLFGSIAQQVLKRGTAPVLLVRARHEQAPQPFEPHRLLVPLDGTAGAEAALEPAREFARLLGADLHLVMVVATARDLDAKRPGLAQVLPSTMRAALEIEEADAGEYLEDIAAGLRSTGIAVTTEVRRGNPRSALADEAAEEGVGLVVIATHGRAGVQAIWAGSVTARMLARTEAPLLLLRTVED
jgi:nucleotide-binding universal stress UspA family protein